MMNISMNICTLLYIENINQSANTLKVRGGFNVVVNRDQHGHSNHSASCDDLYVLTPVSITFFQC